MFFSPVRIHLSPRVTSNRETDVPIPCSQNVADESREFSALLPQPRTTADADVCALLPEYDEYFPDDILTVDIIGIDWYPNDPSEDFVSGVQSFHDKYSASSSCARNIPAPHASTESPVSFL